MNLNEGVKLKIIELKGVFYPLHSILRYSYKRYGVDEYYVSVDIIDGTRVELFAKSKKEADNIISQISSNFAPDNHLLTKVVKHLKLIGSILNAQSRSSPARYRDGGWKGAHSK